MFNIKKKTTQIAKTEDYLDISGILELTPHHTPDVRTLEERQFNWVFICDECQVGHRSHDLVSVGASGLEPFFSGYTADKYSFLIKKLEKQSFPIPFKDLSHPDLPVWMNKQRRIKGELYALRGCSIIELDNYKLNGVQFDRVRVNINVPYHKKKAIHSQTYNGTWSIEYFRSKDHIISIPAYMYIARPEYWLPQLMDTDGCFNFDPVKTWSVDRIWIKDYFEYRRFV